MQFEAFHAVISFAALMVDVCLVYFSVRLFSIFRGGKVAKSWKYMSLGLLALAVGASVFSIKYILHIDDFEIQTIGGLIMLTGGVLGLIGVYNEYNNWKATEG
ncbi:hypothetical protein H5T51_07815 [Candidatus Bathyarchaeota archaeon]|nr:hypothetical protein [Candidatus Bathyarchaeota archaeon]